MSNVRQILVIDDERVIVESARRVLTAEGFPVLTTGDAESALSLMESRIPDIVIIDLSLPGMSGIEFLEIAREAYPAVVVIIMTGYASVENAVAALKAGAFDFLPKPFTFDELLSLITRACRYKTLEEQGQLQPSQVDVSGYYFLGMKAWAKIEKGGAVLLGLTHQFQQTMGVIEAIVMPEKGDSLYQGYHLAKLSASENLEHYLRSPLSGQVVEINGRLEKDPDLLNKDPFHAGWIARIIPVDFQNELRGLRTS